VPVAAPVARPSAARVPGRCLAPPSSGGPPAPRGRAVANGRFAPRPTAAGFPAAVLPCRRCLSGNLQVRGVCRCSAEILLGVALDPVNRPLRVHEVGVRLFAPRQRRARIVDRPLVGVPLADLLLDEIQDQLLPLRGV